MSILEPWRQNQATFAPTQPTPQPIIDQRIDIRAQEIARELLRALDLPPGPPEFRGLQGRRIALLIEPGEDFISAFFGVLLAGGTNVVLSPLHPDAESAFFCQDSRAALLLVSRSWAGRASRFAPSLALRVVEDIPGKESLSENASHPPLAPSLPPLPADSAPALQLYTSGTTGKPKGAVLTHGNLGHQQRLLREAWGLTSSDTLLHVLPLHHMHGLCIALLSSLSAGATIDFVREFRAAEIWDRMERATVFMAVPTIYAKLFQAYDQADAPTRARWRQNAQNLRLATSGSAALPVTLAARWRELTGQIPLERFGMTEVGVALSNPLHGERLEGFVGLPLPTVETRIMSETSPGEFVEAEIGELWVAGPSVFSEYFERPEATRDAFVLRDGFRFFRTGDTVEKNAQGSFRILGRTSVDILKSGGYKLSALEIEEVFRLHPAISEVAVIGLPDPVWGDRVTACVVLKASAPAPTAEELRAFAKEHLAAYKVPKEIQFLAELPRNAMGKVVKPELKQKLQARITEPASD